MVENATALNQLTEQASRNLNRLADRAVILLTRIARGSRDGHDVITYKVLASLLTYEGEPLVDTRLISWVLYRIRMNYAHDWQRYLVAYVVNKKTGEPSSGYYSAAEPPWDATPLPEPREARMLAHRMVCTCTHPH